MISEGSVTRLVLQNHRSAPPGSPGSNNPLDEAIAGLNLGNTSDVHSREEQ